ncbi:suppressor of fused domain protein [Pseudonocardia xinjiangensis]|uniref:suppressor of fused domain protein n=1 Tax=Pseudonocardia xinjiangensis TaxID=75289 RepID=UPI003D8AA86A
MGSRHRRVRPSGRRRMWTYATCGMSQPGGDRMLELHMFGPRPAWELVEILTVVAHFHRTGSALGIGHTVNLGRSWIDNSPCDHALVSLPYLDGPSLENLSLPDGSTVRCAWLIPITSAEVRYKKKHGLEALEERFEAGGLDHLDPHRASVC